MTAVNKSKGRIDLRIPAEVKKYWEEAAALAGVPLSAFVKLAVTERAEALLSTHNTLSLTAEESIALFD